MAGLSSLLLIVTLGVVLCRKSASQSQQHRLLIPLIATKAGIALLAGLHWNLNNSHNSVSSVLTKLYYVTTGAYQLWFPAAIVLVVCTLEMPLLHAHRRTFLLSLLALASGCLSLVQAASLATVLFRGFVVASLPYILNTRLAESRNHSPAPSQSLAACRSRVENSLFGTILLASLALAALAILVSVYAPTWTYVLVEDLLELSLLILISYQHAISLRVRSSLNSDLGGLLSS